MFKEHLECPTCNIEKQVKINTEVDYERPNKQENKRLYRKGKKHLSDEDIQCETNNITEKVSQYANHELFEVNSIEKIQEMMDENSHYR